MDKLPGGLHPDEAANGLDIISMFDAHKFAAIYDTNGPREALFLYLQAIPVYIGKLTGWAFLNFTPLSLRITPAIIGVVTVFGIYLLGKELYSRNVGIFASLALAVSAWHIQFSRNGFRAIMAPLALIFLFYFLIRAYKNGKIQDFIGAGVSLGLGFYTYLSFRMVPLVLMAVLGFIFATDRKFIKKNIKKIGILLLVFLIIMVPMFIHFAYVPADIAGRSSTSIFNPETNGGSPAKALFDNVIKTKLMFNFHGDENFRHNLGGSPMLDLFVGILMWIGVVISVVKIRKLEYFLLIMWFGALSLPELLTSEGIPHALRIVGVMPVVFIWAALGLDWILSKAKAKYALYTGMILLIVISGSAGFYKYFVLFPTYPDSREAYAENMVEMANDIKTQTSETKIILIVGEYGTKSVDYILYPTGKKYDRYEVYTIDSLELPEGHYKMYIEREWKGEAVKELEKLGFKKGLTAVPSKVDNRVIYYEYSQ